MRRICWLILFCMFANLCIAQGKRQMRGAWIATIANIDWPSNRFSSQQNQEQELILLLDSLYKTGINTVIFQVRPCADAFYRSDLEPWSEWLTGKQGKVPADTLFDPLSIVVRESHKRCMEVHAWINPYRVTNGPNAKLAANHIYYKKPYLFKEYGGKLYFNPGMEETADFLVSVIKDIAVRYDVDAFHLDDYFYPYPVRGVDFPDDETYRAHPRGFANKSDWRRDNVNRVVSRIHDTIKSVKPWVQFGVSPFGVWRNLSNDPNGSETRAGITNYDDLYADVLLWAKNGWIDYIAPQMYWEIGKRSADYAVLAPWWRENIPSSCPLYFGLFASGLEVNKPKVWKTPNELVRQMHYNENCVDIEGFLFYSTHYYLRNPQGLLDSLRTEFFTTLALTPEMKEGKAAISPVNIRLQGDTLRWDPIVADSGDAISYYVVYAFPDTASCDFDNPSNIVMKTVDSCYVINKQRFSLPSIYNLTVTAVNRYRKESDPSDFVVYSTTIKIKEEDQPDQLEQSK